MLESALKDSVECMKLSAEEESISDGLFNPFPGEFFFKISQHCV